MKEIKKHPINRKEDIEMEEIGRCPICGNVIKAGDNVFGNDEVNLCFECAVGIYGALKEGVDSGEYDFEILEVAAVFLPELGIRYCAVCNYMYDVDFTVGVDDEVECILNGETYKGVVCKKGYVAKSRVKRNAEKWGTLIVYDYDDKMYLFLNRTMADCIWSDDYIFVSVETNNEIRGAIAVWPRLDSENPKPVELGDRVWILNEFGDQAEGVVAAIEPHYKSFVEKDFAFLAIPINEK